MPSTGPASRAGAAGLGPAHDEPVGRAQPAGQRSVGPPLDPPRATASPWGIPSAGGSTLRSAIGVGLTGRLRTWTPASSARAAAHRRTRSRCVPASGRTTFAIVPPGSTAIGTASPSSVAVISRADDTGTCQANGAASARQELDLGLHEDVLRAPTGDRWAAATAVTVDRGAAAPTAGRVKRWKSSRRRMTRSGEPCGIERPLIGEQGHDRGVGARRGRVERRHRPGGQRGPAPSSPRRRRRVAQQGAPGAGGRALRLKAPGEPSAQLDDESSPTAADRTGSSLLRSAAGAAAGTTVLLLLATLTLGWSRATRPAATHRSWPCSPTRGPSTPHARRSGDPPTGDSADCPRDRAIPTRPGHQDIRPPIASRTGAGRRSSNKNRTRAGRPRTRPVASRSRCPPPGMPATWRPARRRQARGDRHSRDPEGQGTTCWPLRRWAAARPSTRTGAEPAVKCTGARWPCWR